MMRMSACRAKRDSVGSMPGVLVGYLMKYSTTGGLWRVRRLVPPRNFFFLLMKLHGCPDGGTGRNVCFSVSWMVRTSR